MAALAPRHVEDARLLVAGGNDGSSDLSTAEIFSVATMSFSPLPAGLNRARSQAAAATFGAKIRAQTGSSALDTRTAPPKDKAS